MWYICTVEIYLALERNEILIHTTTWVNLEDIMLSEISQTQKDKYCMTIYIKYLKWSNTKREKVEQW